MKPCDMNQAMRRNRGETHPDVYATLAAMTEEERGHFDTLWQKASEAHVEAEVCRRQNASMAEHRAQNVAAEQKGGQEPEQQSEP
eukprot:6694652-Heterocapsa_arctica.AAC.1